MYIKCNKYLTSFRTLLEMKKVWPRRGLYNRSLEAEADELQSCHESQRKDGQRRYDDMYEFYTVFAQKRLPVAPQPPDICVRRQARKLYKNIVASFVDARSIPNAFYVPEK